MPPTDTPPSGLLIFGIVFGLVLSFLAFLWLVSRVKAWSRGEAFLPHRSVMVSTPAPQPVERRTPHTEVMNARSDHQEAIVQSVQRTNVQAEPADFDPPNEDELRMLGVAIRHNATGATKQQSLEMAFGVKKGGSVGWRRASQLFDLATAPAPDPYPHLHAQRSASRWEPEVIEKP
jgi:hypothetical protein